MHPLFIFALCCLTLSSSNVLDSCPKACDCKRDAYHVNVSCTEGGLNDRTLSDLLQSIPIDATAIRIESSSTSERNSFSMTQDFVRFQKLRQLRLVNCGLSSLGTRTFENLKALKLLDLSTNNIESLSPETFANTDHLERLILAGNRLNLANLPTAAFAYLTNLVHLDLSSNRLHGFSANLFVGLTQLRHLNLNQNKLTSTSFESLLDLPALELLSVSSCQLASIPDNAFGNNPQLRVLDLSDNQLTSLSINSSSLLNLNVSNNRFDKEVSISFIGTPKLKILHMSNNKLAANDLSTIGRMFREVATLEELNLANNTFTHVDASIFPNSLKSLDLSSNPLRSIKKQHTQGLANLHTLRLSDAQLKSLPDVLPLEYVKLKMLDLSRNDLHELNAKSISQLKSLKVLNLSFNKFTSVPDQVVRFMEKLRFVYLYGNPWHCACGTESLKQYLLADRMRGLCGAMSYERITCATPKHLNGTPLVLVEKATDCDQRIFGAAGLRGPSELGLLIAGVCGALLLLGLIAAVLCSYLLPRATYRTNEEKTNLSSSSSEQSNHNEIDFVQKQH